MKAANTDYLAELRKHLKPFSAGEQKAILEEIDSHLESANGEETGDAKKIQRMGTPADMGRGFHNVYSPGRFVDFLLVLIPAYLIFPLLLPLLIRFFGKYPADLSASTLALDMRLCIALGVLFAILGRVRHSRLLLAFWIPDVLARLISLMTSEQRWLAGAPGTGGPSISAESIFWYAVLSILTAWLLHFLWQNRSDSLIVFFALLPFIDTLLNVTYIGLFGIPSVGLQWNFMGVTLWKAIEIASLAGFFLLLQRDWRWCSLLVGQAVYLVVNFSANRSPLAVAGLWAIACLLLLALWFIDWRQRRSLSSGN